MIEQVNFASLLRDVDQWLSGKVLAQASVVAGLISRLDGLLAIAHAAVLPFLQLCCCPRKEQDTIQLDICISTGVTDNVQMP